MSESLHATVERAKENLTSGTVKLGEYVNWSMFNTTNRIQAYLNSVFVDGVKDSLGRDKPFFNIVTSAVNIWYRATDIDRKDIVIVPDAHSDMVASLLANILLQDWMNRNRFNVFLNNWGRTLAQYGSAVVKFVEKDGGLTCSVVPWRNLIVDQVDFNSLPVIEKLEKTPAQLVEMATPGHPNYAGYDLEQIKRIVDSKQVRKTLRGEQKDLVSEFIELYEVHGLMSAAVYKEARGEESDEKDESVFFQQMYVICSVDGEDGSKEDLTLYSGKEKQNPYLLTHLIEEDGRTLAIGAVESLFDSQWMANHTIKQWKDQMELASKLIFQTANQAFGGVNVLTDIQTGDILYHAPNMPVEAFPNFGHDIGNLKSFLDQWKIIGNENTAASDSMKGTTPPSGTPYSTVALLAGQSNSLFEIMVENKGNDIEKMLTNFIIPHLKTKMDTNDEVAAILEDRDITKIDSAYVPRRAVRSYNKEAVEKVKKALSNPDGLGELPENYDQNKAESQVKAGMAELGNMRFLTPGNISWKEVVKDLEWRVKVNVTNESSDKQTILTTIVSMLQTIAQNPLVLNDPRAKLLFNKALALTNVVSPVELSSLPAPQEPVMASQGSALEGLTANQT